MELTEDDWDNYNSFMKGYYQYIKDILNTRKEKIRKIWKL